MRSSVWTADATGNRQRSSTDDDDDDARDRRHNTYTGRRGRVVPRLRGRWPKLRRGLAERAARAPESRRDLDRRRFSRTSSPTAICSTQARVAGLPGMDHVGPKCPRHARGSTSRRFRRRAFRSARSGSHSARPGREEASAAVSASAPSREAHASTHRSSARSPAVAG